MADGSDGLWQELSALADAYAELARGMLQAARRLQSPGALPDRSLTEEIGRLQRATDGLLARGSDAAAALGVPLPDAATLGSLKGIAALVQAIAEAEERIEARAARLREAVALLDRVIALSHIAEPEFAPLLACQDQARDLRAQIEAADPRGDLDDATLGLLDRDHPFAYLLMLVDGVEVMADDLWESLFEAVGRAFSRPLAAAVARAKIVAAPVEVPAAEAEAEPTVIETPTAQGESLTLEVVFDGTDAGSDEPAQPARAAASAAGTGEVIDALVDEAISFLPRGFSGLLSARRNVKAARRRSAPRVERLEKVRLLSCNTISGFVFLDANNDGLLQPGERPVAGNPIELRNASDIVVGTATTDASGYYSFSTDQTIDITPRNVEQTITIADQPTNFARPYTINQFDPALGELIGVDIIVQGQLASRIRAENLSRSSADMIVGTVAGTITLTGPGVNLTGTINAPAGTFNAAPFDGADDYAGPSGTDFGVQTAPIAQSLSLVKGTDDLTPFVGTGTLPGTFEARANSGASGGGNLGAMSDSTAGASVRVVYRYVPSNCLAEGRYTIVQPQQPPGTLNGKHSSEGNVYPPSTGGPDSINVVLGDTDLTNNDFGELVPSRLAGVVYFDRNDDGVKDAGEPGISGTTITLTGSDDLGSVSRTLQTDGTGAYDFGQLRPGTYEIVETQPAGYLDGKDTLGTQGGTAANDRFYGINLGQGVNGVDNNFGELRVAGLSGYVYWDRNNDGLKDAAEPGIPGTVVRLRGVDSLGNAVDVTNTTDATGAYSFPDLRPGTYEMTETQPADYLDGKDTLGTLGGTAANDRFYGINLTPDASGLNYNFGELRPSSLNGYVYVDRNNDGIKAASEAGIPGVRVTLTGTDDLGAGVNLSTLTDAAGAYNFGRLRPGTYRIDEAQPAAYLDGKDTVGSQGGTLGNDVISNIGLPQDVDGINNNFGELPPAAINGYVYVDVNRNGLRDPGEPGLPNITIALSGTDDLGQAVARNVATDANGFYDFSSLRPGTYDLRQPTQPAGYADGQEARNNRDIIPNSTTTDIIPGIVLTPGAVDPDDNFGEVQGGGPSDKPCPVTQPLGVDRLGIHHQPTRFVIRFSQPLDPASAEDLSHYQLVRISRDGRVARGTIPLQSAVYNEADWTVTLTPAVRLNIHYHYRLTVRGLVDQCPQLVDGDRDGLPGGDYVTVLTKTNYPGRLPCSPPQAAATSWTQRFPRLAAGRPAAPPAPNRARHHPG